MSGVVREKDKRACPRYHDTAPQISAARDVDYFSTKTGPRQKCLAPLRREIKLLKSILIDRSVWRDGASGRVSRRSSATSLEVDHTRFV
jgi:hypothetical protein